MNNVTTTTISKVKALAWLKFFTGLAIDCGSIVIRPNMIDDGFMTVISVDDIDVFVHDDIVHVDYRGYAHRRYTLK